MIASSFIKRDVEVALRVLDDLGGLGHLDRRRLVRARRNDLAVEPINRFGGLGRRAARHLGDRRQAMRLVARIDALRTVADEEILVERET